MSFEEVFSHTEHIEHKSLNCLFPKRAFSLQPRIRGSGFGAKLVNCTARWGKTGNLPPPPPATVLQTLIINELGCNKGATIWLICSTCSTLASHPWRPLMATAAWRPESRRHWPHFHRKQRRTRHIITTCCPQIIYKHSKRPPVHSQATVDHNRCQSGTYRSPACRAVAAAAKEEPVTKAVTNRHVSGSSESG